MKSEEYYRFTINEHELLCEIIYSLLCRNRWAKQKLIQKKRIKNDWSAAISLLAYLKYVFNVQSSCMYECVLHRSGCICADKKCPT